MARITVEDCIDKVEGPYDLVLIAKERAVQLNSGEQPKVDPENDKNTVIALKEIAENKVSVDELKESAINKLRKHIEQDTEVSEQIETEGDDFENIYKGEISKSGVPILPSKRARKIPEKIEIIKEEPIEKEIFKNESLPENKEISLQELEDQEKTKEGSDELVDPKSSDNA
jgi:DNA-directed RNA polymerase subunit omega|tara:strand:+ start:55 stop:570 length:516 start_codon:yes stop_codon:yes gene_type:complete